MQAYYSAPDGISLYHGDCRAVLASLEPESVDTVVTSPPYLGLRAYEGVEPGIWGGSPECEHIWGDLERGKRKDILPADVTTLDSRTGIDDRQNGAATNGGRFCRRCNAWLGCYGNEPEISLYVAHTVEVCQGIWRVLKPSGTVWWNIGDSYCTRSVRRENGNRDTIKAIAGESMPKWSEYAAKGLAKYSSGQPGLKDKDLQLIPYRVAIALQEAGWYVRSAITWAKKSCMPESVTDRPTCATEMIWLLAKSERYYFDAEAVREDFADERCGNPGSYRWAYSTGSGRNDSDTGLGSGNGWNKGTERGGRNMRNFWHLGPEPLREAHYAAFPSEIPRRAILAGSPVGGTVLDPFVGSGTSLIVARQLGRRGVGIDASAHYLDTIAIPRLEGQTPNLFAEVLA